MINTNAAPAAVTNHVNPVPKEAKMILFF